MQVMLQFFVRSEHEKVPLHPTHPRSQVRSAPQVVSQVAPGEQVPLQFSTPRGHSSAAHEQVWHSGTHTEEQSAPVHASVQVPFAGQVGPDPPSGVDRGGSWIGGTSPDASSGCASAGPCASKSASKSDVHAATAISDVAVITANSFLEREGARLCVRSGNVCSLVWIEWTQLGVMRGVCSGSR